MANLYITSGDAYTGDRRLTMTVATDGTATDLTGVDMTFMVKRRKSDETAVITKTVGDGIEITDAEGGIARIALAEADTDALNGRYEWELEADDAEGKLTLATGRLYVTRDMIGV